MYDFWGMNFFNCFFFLCIKKFFKLCGLYLEIYIIVFYELVEEGFRERGWGGKYSWDIYLREFVFFYFEVEEDLDYLRIMYFYWMFNFILCYVMFINMLMAISFKVFLFLYMKRW